MQFETIPTFIMPNQRAELSDWEIENPRATSAEKEHYEFQRADNEVLTPPIFPGTERNHQDVARVHVEAVETQPSIIEQHNNMTHQEQVVYMRTMTPMMPKVRSEYTLAA